MRGLSIKIMMGYDIRCRVSGVGCRVSGVGCRVSGEKSRYMGMIVLLIAVLCSLVQ